MSAGTSNNMSIFDFSDINGGAVFLQGGISVDLMNGKYEKIETGIDATTQKESELNAENNISIDSGNDLIIAGSNINAGGDITLAAVNNVSIETTEEKTDEYSKETTGEFTLTGGVTHASGDVYNAGLAVKDAKDALAKGYSDYKDYKKSIDKAEKDYDNKLIDEDDLDSIRSDEKYYQANIALLTQNLVSKTVALASATVAAGGSVKTLGFNANLQLNIDGKISETQTTATTAKGSIIGTGGNLTITSGKTAKIEGSDINAAENILIDSKDVEILAGKSTSDSSTNEKSVHLGISLSTSGNVGINASGSTTNSDSDSTTYTNSHLNASNIKIKSSNDTTVAGGVVNAENNLSLNIGGDLLVKSLQDKESSKSVTLGLSGGGSSDTSGGNLNGNAGANFNISKSDKKWVTEQTSLTGGTVDIYVENKTTLRGAVIASTTGDLTLDTGSLEFSNIKDKDISKNLGGGVSGSSTSTNGKDENGNATVQTNNTGSVNATYGFTDLRQTNFATIGEGTITVRDGNTGLTGLNRDVTISQYGTKDGGLQGGFTVDTATVNMVSNVIDAVKDPNQAIADVKAITDKAIKDVGERNDKIIAGAKDLEKQAEVVVEKTGNLIEYNHFTTDGKVQYCLNMDDYEAQKANGGEITALDTLVYVKSKSAAGEELTRSDISDLRLSSGIVLDGATDAIKENLESNIRVNSREDILSSLAVLDKYDSGDAKDARSYLAGIRAAGEERQYISDEISKIDISLANNEKEISKVQKLINKNDVVCIQIENKTENQYYVLVKNDGIELDGKGADGKAVYTVNTDTIEYVIEKESMLSSITPVKYEVSTSGQAVYKADYTESDSVYTGMNDKGAVIGISHKSSDLTSNGSSAYTETSLTVTGKGAAAGTAVVAVTVAATVIIKNPGAAVEIATGLIPSAIPVVTPVLQTAK